MKDKYYDKLLNVNTMENKKTIYPASHHYNPYEPTPYSALERLFQIYSFHHLDHIVDFGCGKGRLSFYLHYFQRVSVTGIEMDADCYAVAQQNLQSYHHLYAPADNQSMIRFICCLAEEYNITEADNRFYFFNPFSIQIFKQVVLNILKSVETAPREADIILYYPHQTYVQFLEYHTPFELLHELKLKAYWLNPDERILIYRLTNQKNQEKDLV